jgi:hypothetical protein
LQHDQRVCFSNKLIRLVRFTSEPLSQSLRANLHPFSSHDTPNENLLALKARCTSRMVPTYRLSPPVDAGLKPQLRGRAWPSSGTSVQVRMPTLDGVCCAATADDASIKEINPRSLKDSISTSGIQQAATLAGAESCSRHPSSVQQTTLRGRRFPMRNAP